MAVDPEIETLLQDLLEPIEGVTFKRMFGGLGVFRHGLMFALYSAEGQFALKADDQNVPMFDERGVRRVVSSKRQTKQAHENGLLAGAGTTAGRAGRTDRVGQRRV